MIKFYTIHCANCNVLQKKLEQAGIEFQIIDDNDTIMEFAKNHNIKSAPFIDTGEEVLPYLDAIKWVNKHKQSTNTEERPADFICGSCEVK